MGQLQSSTTHSSGTNDTGKLTEKQLQRIKYAYIVSFSLPGITDLPFHLLNREWNTTQSESKCKIARRFKKLSLGNAKSIQQDISNHYHGASSSTAEPNGLPPPTKKAPIYPFTDHILSENGAFTMEPELPSEYIETNESNIHPIFHSKNFDTTLLGAEKAQKAYLAMGPALALASKWLTAPEARRGFWHRIYFGKHAPHPTQKGSSYLSASPLEEDFPRANALFEKHLLALSQNLKFVWAPEKLSASTSTINGVTLPTPWSAITSIPIFKNPSTLSFLTSDPDLLSKLQTTFAPCIALSTKYLFHLLSSKSCADPSSLSRLHFALATLLCHELTHLIYASRAPFRGPEPYFSPSHEMPELGISWEFFLLGGRSEFDVSVSHIGYLATRSWRFACSFPALCTVVPMWWVKDWFLKTIWEDGFEEFRVSELWGKGRRAGEQMGWRFATRWDQRRREWCDLVFFRREGTWVEGKEEKIGEVEVEGVYRPQLVERWEEWFEEVRGDDARSAVEAGRGEEVTGAWGDYGELLGEECC